MKITDTIKTLKLYNDWRRSGEGEQLNPRLISQAIDAAIAQLSEHRAMLLRIDQLSQKLKQARVRKMQVRVDTIAECAQAIGMSEPALIALLKKS